MPAISGTEKFTRFGVFAAMSQMGQTRPVTLAHPPFDFRLHSVTDQPCAALQNVAMKATSEGLPDMNGRPSEVALIEVLAVLLDDRAEIVRVLADDIQPILLWFANRSFLNRVSPLAPMRGVHLY